MKTLVTGAAGFIGSNFLRFYFEREDQKNDFLGEITVVDKLTYAGRRTRIDDLVQSRKISFVEGDVCDKELMLELTQGVDLIVNFAAESHVDNSIKGGGVFVQSNIFGVQVILDSMRANKVRQLCQISTDEVYGSLVKGEASESSPLNPSSPYSASKASADLLILAHVKTYGIRATIIRPCNNFGPNQHEEKLIPKVIQSLVGDADIPIYGEGDNVREWIYVDDFSKFLLHILFSKLSGVFNIGSGLRKNNLQIVSEIMQHFPNSTSSIRFIEDRLGHDYRYAINSMKVDSQIQREFTPFEKAMSETISSYLKELPS